MPFKTSYNAALGQPAFNFAGVDNVARVAIGRIEKGFDDLLGEGEFIYLPGAAGVLAGDHVLFDLAPGASTVTRSTTGNANSGQPSAIAVAAVPAGSFGWYQVSGCAVVNVIGGTAVGRAFLSATAGQLSSTATGGSQLVGARISSAVGVPAAGQAYITLTRPAVQGQIT
jgi:hypothetical protein